MVKVLVFGTFDIVHCGHLNMFKQARAYGDRLTVIVSTDKNAGKIKGIGPFHNEEERRGFLSHFDLIDEVYVGNEDDPYKCLIQHKPDIIALGYDQKVFVDRLEDKITEYGLETRIVRLAPYGEDRFKTGKIRKYIERVI